MMALCIADTETQPCYSGSAATKNKGACKDGKRTCNKEGSAFGECVGQVLPALKDDCTKNIDATCDEKLICPCMAGSTMDCYDGATGTKGVEPCKGGTRTCQADEMGYGPCEGQVTPKTEDCATSEDEDCNGHAYDDTAAGCVCEPKKTSDCTTTLQGVCSDGTQVCLDTGKGFDVCNSKVQPSFDDCFTTMIDEDCDGKTPACTGGTLGAGAAISLNNDDVVFSVASDKVGNIFLGGASSTTEGNTYFPITGIADIIKLDPSGTLVWGKTYPATGNSSYSVVRGVTVDDAGNSILVGEYRGKISPKGAALNSAMGSVDVFVIKLDKNGTPLWSKSFGNGGDQFGTSIDVAANGDVFLCGYMKGTMSFGSTTLTTNGNSYSDLFVARLDVSTGDPKWAKNFGDDGSQAAWHLAATPDGNVVVTGSTYGDINFGGGNIGYGGFNKADIFLAKLDGNDGGQMWAKHFGDGSDQAGYGVDADASGNIVLTGILQGSTDFGGPIPLSAGLGKPEDIFVARFGEDGSYKWANSFGDNYSQTAYGVAVDGAGNAIITGKFNGTLAFGSTMLMNMGGPAGSPDVFVAKLRASDGTIGWARSFGDTDDQVGWAVTTDFAGNVILGGAYKGTIDFGPPAALTFTSTNNYDAFWAKLAP